jgi:hypothetical protein
MIDRGDVTLTHRRQGRPREVNARLCCLAACGTFMSRKTEARWHYSRFTVPPVSA